MPTHLENATVIGNHAPLPGARGRLEVDNGNVFTSQSDANGRLSFVVEVAPEHLGWGANLVVEADGFVPFRMRVQTGHGDHELPNARLVALPPPLPKEPLLPAPSPVAPSSTTLGTATSSSATTTRSSADGSRRARATTEQLPRLRVDGRSFVTEQGRPFTWRGATGFRAVEKVARRQQAEVTRFFDVLADHGVTVVRVLAMARNLFDLPPDTGAQGLTETLDLARRAGLYVEVVGLADTASYTFDRRAFIATLGAICASAGNAVLELANEPVHDTQAHDVGDAAYLLGLRALVPSSVPVALGAAHGDDDESRAFVGGDYVTVHGARGDGDGGWRFIRHTNEQRALSEEVGKPVVNDEPKRDDLAEDKHLAMAALCRIMGLGDTFHSAAGLQALPPVGDELAALAARQRGWELVPEGFSGAYRNTGFVDAPVERFEDGFAVRMYSAVSGDTGYTLGLGVAPGASRCRWSDRWPSRTLLCEAGGMRFWRVSR